jgi:hypothetical protein
VLALAAADRGVVDEGALEAEVEEREVADDGDNKNPEAIFTGAQRVDDQRRDQEANREVGENPQVAAGGVSQDYRPDRGDNLNLSSGRSLSPSRTVNPSFAR